MMIINFVQTTQPCFSVLWLYFYFTHILVCTHIELYQNWEGLVISLVLRQDPGNPQNSASENCEPPLFVLWPKVTLGFRKLMEIPILHHGLRSKKVFKRSYPFLVYFYIMTFERVHFTGKWSKVNIKLINRVQKSKLMIWLTLLKFYFPENFGERSSSISDSVCLSHSTSFSMVSLHSSILFPAWWLSSFSAYIYHEYGEPQKNLFFSVDSKLRGGRG